MSTSSKISKRNNLELEAAAAERDVQTNTDVDRRLQAAIRGAELYMQALTLADTPAVRKRLDAKTKQLLATAETLKANQTVHRQQAPASSPHRPYPESKRKLTTRENIILLEGSKLNGAVFKPWAVAPVASEFELKDGQAMFTDETDYPLSPVQLESFAGWERAPIALAAVENSRSDPHFTSLEPCMLSNIEGADLVQDVTSDCSVVASLCAGAARDGDSNRKILRTIMFPYDNENRKHVVSANGKYIFRFYFNGCWRRVEIDDRLPTSKSKRTLHVVDRAHPDLLWPALLEKAYLKIRGGYDFPGSNSATDVAVMGGWIPQQLFLHDDDIDPAQIWNELFDAFVKGDILLTLGTGRLGKREQKQLGLAPDHDYAVLDMQQAGNVREMLIKNPWADGEVWKGAARRKPHPGHEADDLYAIPLSPLECENMIPGTFWMDFDHIFQYFQNAYVNWNPSLFTVREDAHFTLEQRHANSATALPVNNPQFAVTSTSEGEVWLLLSRHFRTGDYTSANNGKNGYISLYLFENDGKHIFSAVNAKVRGPFVDSPNTILRVTLTARQPLTVVVLCQDMPFGSHNFTLSALSNANISLSEAQHQFHSPTLLSAAWTRSTSGGNSDSPHYLQNPQFGLTTPHNTKIALLLEVDDTVSSVAQNEIPVKLAIVRSDGSRITKLRRRETTITSGDYRRGSAIIETVLEKGSYTVICSTFEQGQHARFSLSLYTESTQTPLRLTPIASERSGRLSVNVAPAVFGHDVRKLIAPLTITRTTSAIVLASLARGKSSSLFKISIEKGQGPNRTSLASSADEETEYNSLAHGLRVTCTGLTPVLANMATGGVWLVVERPEQSSDHELEDHVVRLELLAEERIDFGQWAPLDD